jgi:predicted nucleic acid-binding protein
MVIADTNIFIASIRGNEIADTLLMKYQKQLGISVISLIELKVGATDKKKKRAVEMVTDIFSVIPLSKYTGEKAIQLVDLYNTPQRRLQMPDALIAATCIEHNAKLLTFNTKDFKFIKGLKLAK